MPDRNLIWNKNSEASKIRNAKRVNFKNNMALFIVVSASVIFLIMTGVIVYISYEIYKTALYEYGNELCLRNNAQAAYVIDGDLVERYAKTLTVDEEYEEFAAKLDELGNRINAKYFYILVTSGVPGMYTYIYNATHSEESPGERYALGKTVAVAEHEGAEEVLRSGKAFSEALYYNEIFGELYYAYAPIFNSKEQVVAFVGTDIDIAPLHSGMNSYREKIIITLAVAFISFLLLYLVVVRRTVAKSMDQITDRANMLSDSLHILKNILNGMDAYIYVSDLQTDEILFINDKMKEHFGLKEDVIGEICWKVLQSGFTQRCDFCPNKRLMDCPDIPVVWEEHNSVTDRFYENNDSTIEWTDGKKVHLQHSVDITELKNSEASLKKRLEQQELMSSISQSFISEEDVDVFIDNALQLTGEFMNVSRIELSEYNEKGQVLEFRNVWRNSKTPPPLKTGDKFPFPKDSPIYDKLITKDEPIIIVENIEDKSEYTQKNSFGVKAFMSIPILVSGRFWGVLGFDQCEQAYHWSESDIHLANLLRNLLSGVLSRKIMEEEKKAVQEKTVLMSSVLESSPQYISYIDKEGKWKYLNPAAPKITGYSYEELMNGGMELLYDEESIRLIKEVIPIVFIEGKYSFELPLRRKDGEVRIMSCSAFTVGTERLGIGTIAKDITEQKRLEAELIEAKELAEQGNMAKSEFLSRMSHEMRTPMNAIIGMTGIARNTNDIKKKEHCLERITNASKHLLGVINDILDMSKIEANKFELYCQEFDFEKMLMNITNVISFRAEEKKQKLTVNLNKNVPLSLIGDELRLTQVITNLMTNAVKFTPEGGKIMLNIDNIAESDGKTTLRVEVCDTGIGISAEQQVRLFTSFEQADGSISRRFGGTGLGLAISKRIVELMDGEIWIESELDVGSKFIFTINIEKGENNTQNNLSAEINNEDLRILAVDDSAETREYFTHVMEAFGLHCDVASGGEEALSMIQNCKGKPYNFFFVDWQMPGMNGIELTARIKNIIKEKSIVIMISAAEWNEIEKEALAAGVNQFIPKPLFPSTLLNSINECLGVPNKSKTEMTMQDSSGQSKWNFKNHTLLLAEDVDINREIIMGILEETGITIDFAETGTEAVALFKENPGKYSLILMDIQMPEMDGYEASQKIRSLGYTEAKNIPIIAMTANVFREDIENCLSAGMNEHIGKPIDTDDLFKKLNMFLPTKTASAEEMTPEETELPNDDSEASGYGRFLPDIDIQSGLGRMMNNKKLYGRLIEGFAGRQMADELIQYIKNLDFENTARVAHALKGVSANLGFVKLAQIATNIEVQAKAGVESDQQIVGLDEAINQTVNIIKKLLESEEV